MAPKEALLFNGSAQLRKKEREPRGRVVVITGVTGVGKDWLLDQAMDGSERSVSRINVGTLLADALASDPDALRSAHDAQTIEAALRTVTDTIVASSPAVLTSHVVAKQGSLLITNPSFERDIRPQAYVVVTADPSEIHRRRQERNARGGRRSDLEDVEYIALHQELLIAAAAAYARRFGAQLVILVNTQEKQEENIRTLQSLIALL